ncbi:MAG: hypothetical protein IE936_09640 [Moraxella osloensis]|nr:hypothetical protein [Moraxella osloensis]
MIKKTEKQSELAERFIALHNQFRYKFWPIGEKAFADYQSNDMYDLRQQRLQRLEENAAAQCGAKGIEKVYKAVITFQKNARWRPGMGDREYAEMYNAARERAIEEIADILRIEKTQPLEGLPHKVQRVLEINGLALEVLGPKNEDGYPVYMLYFSGYTPEKLY